jgi:hypothetical protein
VPHTCAASPLCNTHARLTLARVLSLSLSQTHVLKDNTHSARASPSPHHHEPARVDPHRHRIPMALPRELAPQLAALHLAPADSTTTCLADLPTPILCRIASEALNDPKTGLDLRTTAFVAGSCRALRDVAYEALKHFHSLRPNRDLPSGVLEAVLPHLPSLTALDLRACFFVVSDATLAAAAQLSQLTALHLDHCSQITEVGIQVCQGARHVACHGLMASQQLAGRGPLTTLTTHPHHPPIPDCRRRYARAGYPTCRSGTAGGTARLQSFAVHFDHVAAWCTPS